MWDSATRSDKPEDIGGQEVQIIQKEDFDKQVQREVQRRMNIFLQQKEVKRLREQLLKSSKRLTFRGSIKRSRLLWIMNMAPSPFLMVLMTLSHLKIGGAESLIKFQMRWRALTVRHIGMILNETNKCQISEPGVENNEFTSSRADHDQDNTVRRSSRLARVENLEIQKDNGYEEDGGAASTYLLSQKETHYAAED